MRCIMNKKWNTREEEQPGYKLCVLILFAMVSWAAGRKTSIISTHLLPLYPLCHRGGGKRWHLEKPIVPQLSTVCQKKLLGLWDEVRKEPMKTWGEHANSTQKTQDLLAVRGDNYTMVSPYYISWVYLLKVCLWSLNYSLQQIHHIYQHLHQSSPFPNVMPPFTAPTD